MTAFTYEVEKRSPEHVQQELCRLWESNLALASTPLQRFRWLYLDAPECSDSVFLLNAKDNDGSGARTVVGTTGVTVRRFQIGTRDVRATLNGDLAVDLAHRGLLPALQLLRAAREHESAGFAFAYGFPNAKAEGVMVRAGFRVLGRTTRYARVLRHASYGKRISERPGVPPLVARMANDPRVAATLGPVVDMARLATSAADIASARRHYRLTWPAAFDARFDALWDQARREYEIVGARTSAFLAWSCPKPEIAALVRRSDRALVAYAIVERDRTTGAAHLRDVFGHKSELLPLFDLLVPSLWSRGAVSISVRFLGAPHLANILRAHGFEERAEHRTVVVQVGKDAEDDRARIEDAQTWHLFDVDEDG